jgi:hypothetical protein
MSNICILGIDPGSSGAIALYWPSDPGTIMAEDVPVVNGMISPSALARRLEEARPTVAMIELVGAMPKQGVSSTFKFGMACGIVHGVVGSAYIPVHLVAPGKWKKHFRLPSDKEASRALATRLWPSATCFSRKKDHGRAEAALLARYAAETLFHDVRPLDDWSTLGGAAEAVVEGLVQRGQS